MPTQAKSYPGTYVVNRAGHYYAGNRCAPMLAEAAVWPAGDATPADGFGDAPWRAVSDPPLVVEFELFAPYEPGAVGQTGGTEVSLSDPVVVALRDANGRWYTVEVVLDQIPDGMVADGATATTWLEFTDYPGWGLGC
jgi:hypothetical protein